jgi:tetratricopeptide (TPR) repeat protein
MAIWADYKSADARPLIAQAATLIDAHERPDDPDWLDTRLLLREVEIDTADWDNRPQAVIEVALKTLDELATWPDELRGDERYAVARARALLKLGDGVYYAKDRPDALPHYLEADRLLREAAERLPNRPAILSARVTAGWSVATTLVNIERASEAPAVFEETLAVLGRLAAFERHDQALDRQRLLLEAARAEALSILGRHAEAIAGLEASLDHRQARFEASPRDTSRARDLAFGRLTLGDAYWRNADRGRACGEWNASAASLRKLLGADALNAWDVDDTLGQLEVRSEVCAGREPEASLDF